MVRAVSRIKGTRDDERSRRGREALIIDAIVSAAGGTYKDAKGFSSEYIYMIHMPLSSEVYRQGV